MKNIAILIHSKSLNLNENNFINSAFENKNLNVFLVYRPLRNRIFTLSWKYIIYILEFFILFLLRKIKIKYLRKINANRHTILELDSNLTYDLIIDLSDCPFSYLNNFKFKYFLKPKKNFPRLSHLDCLDETTACSDKISFSLHLYKGNLNDKPLKYHGFFQSTYSLILNQILFNSYIYNSLRLITLDYAMTGNFIKFSYTYNKIPSQNFCTSNVFLYFSKFSIAIFSKIKRRILRKKFTWSVNIYSINSNLVLSLKAPKLSFIADPFLFKFKSNIYCFVENYNFLTKKGCIDSYKLIKNNFIRLGSVLEEPFHVSFPFLFKHNSNIYMCPETIESGMIRIYKAIKFPIKWQIFKILKSPVAGADPLIFKHGKYWWLFLNTDMTSTKNFSNELSIYYSNSPFSDNWIPHKLNPIFIDSEKARNGGFFLIGKDKIRVGQVQSHDLYGSAISLYKIKKLNRFKYEEIKLASVKPSNSNIKGVHHLSYLKPYFTHDYLEIK